ncbi:hypothetical protein MGYG_05665 [Nannizzia gypsea CBS 118893]|uniref:Uncharacterized protein n=1 Tax=Arthroderma gypseum (strain ATCC MYA-4604 / CBS 118893) TaxID=535722 RepID=E4UX81_ARTGP|nr:hypothetical protein MGYG_05665 [Nannizzia gypsea CBS 118893]EFR02668.1 hypothetical protein MGYG_05665 [Nannizzia gypsea CBS 118893]
MESISNRLLRLSERMQQWQHKDKLHSRLSISGQYSERLESACTLYSSPDKHGMDANQSSL